MKTIPSSEQAQTPDDRAREILARLNAVMNEMVSIASGARVIIPHLHHRSDVRNSLLELQEAVFLLRDSVDQLTEAIDHMQIEEVTVRIRLG